MTTRTFDVSRMQPGERSAVVAGLARAFYDDPLFGYFLTDPIAQSRGLLTFMGAGVSDAMPFGEIWVARSAGKIASAAVWLPPDAYPRNARREILTNVRGAPTFARSGRRITGALKLLNALAQAHHHVKEPHFYLSILGSDPLFQRVGAGSAALQPVLDRCDAEGLIAFLETQKEENLAYYARHAFELIEKVEVEGVPPVWTLSRNPR